ncbi:MAG: hydroxymethylbilane synthase [Candidatus Aminicenantales bacterium]
MNIRIGTRGSKLALAQAGIIKSSLESLNRALEIELKIIKTRGDKVLSRPLALIEDKGLFVKEIEVALLEKKIDIGVHSLKDIPTEQPAELMIAAIPEREIPNDAFISNEYSSLSEIKRGGVIGTSSLRRKSQLLNLRPDLVIKDIRGNMDTRLKKLDRGEYDALVLAAAGLKRLGFEERITELLSLDSMVPAVAQGALALETRAGDEEILDLCRLLTHEETQKAVEEEREFLSLMGGGCQVPLGCYACFKDSDFSMIGFIGDLEGKEKISHKLRKGRNEYRGYGKHLAKLLLEEGGSRILEKIRK